MQISPNNFWPQTAFSRARGVESKLALRTKFHSVLIKFSLCLILATMPAVGCASPQEPLSFAGDSLQAATSSFHSYLQYNFQVDGIDASVVVPKVAADGIPWIWRARFFGHEPQVDIALLELGFHVAYIDVVDLYGAPEAVRRWDSIYDFLTLSHGFSRKVVLEGMSRGGLVLYNWASRNPEKVACIYADAPVMDFKSWPGGFRSGDGDEEAYEELLRAYNLNESEALDYPGNPIDNLKPLADARIPILHIVGDLDTAVPVSENTEPAVASYERFGGQMQVVHKPNVGHHPHSLEDPSLIVKFVQRCVGKLDAPEQD